MVTEHAETDKIATFLHHQGVRPGEAVACFMSNSPEMVFSYLALAKLGAIPALINISLRSQFGLTPRTTQFNRE